MHACRRHKRSGCKSRITHIRGCRGCCGTCRNNLSYRFGKNPSSEKYKPFPCESEDQYYQNVIDVLRKLPRGSSQNKECTCFICEPAHADLKSVRLQPGVPKPEFSNQVSRDNRTLDQSRLDEVTEKFENMTPKSKDAFVVLRIKEKQEQEQKSIEDPLSFRGAAGGAPIEVIAGAKAKKKLLYDNTTPVAKKVFENLNIQVHKLPLSLQSSTQATQLIFSNLVDLCSY